MRRSFWYAVVKGFPRFNPHKPPRSVAKISEGGHPRLGWELTFTSATQVNRFRPRSTLVHCKALVKAVSWSMHKLDVCSYDFSKHESFLGVGCESDHKSQWHNCTLSLTTPDAYFIPHLDVRVILSSLFDGYFGRQL